MKTGVLVGVITLGIATTMLATDGPDASRAQDYSRSMQRDMSGWQGQNVDVHQTISPDGTVTVTCPQADLNYQNSAAYSDVTAPKNTDITTNQSSNQTGCRHWYRWFAPGHSTRCGWNNASRSMRTGCCW